MSTKYYDIIIIGAGISGLSVAHAITKNSNATIAILEGKTIGSNNPSPLTFTDIIKEHDLSDCAKGCYSSFSFHNYQGSFIKFVFGDYPLLVLDYKRACHKLFNSIQKRDNTLEFINTHAISFSRNANTISIILKDNVHIQAKILIDCSGKSKFITTQLADNRFSYYSHVYGATFSNIKGSENDLCCFLWPHKEFGSGGGWFYLLPDRKASFGYASITNSPIADHTQLKYLFHRASKCYEPYSDYLKDANLDTIESGTIPITYNNKFVYDNIVTVGDAAGMATNWTCMGIEPALKYGKIAGELSAKAISQNDLTILNELQILWEKENKATYDLFAKYASKFWSSDFNYWEWIIKNDLSFLSPQQVIDRMRNNKHLRKKHHIISRYLNFKFKSIFNKNISSPSTILITD